MNRRGRFVIFILMSLVLLSAAAGAQETDATMRFYLDNTAYVFDQNFIFNKEADFSFKVRSILERTDYRGKLEKVDTAVYDIHVASGKVDSINVIDSASQSENVPPDSFAPFLPWEEGNFDFYFYPNDTGAGRLAVGYETPGGDTVDIRSGFMNINRDNFTLQSVFLHSRDEEGFQRLSRVYSFERSDGVIRPLKYEEYRVKIAFMGHNYTRIYAEFFDYQLK